MKFIIDAHLPRSICNFFGKHDCIHTSQLEFGNETKDSLINELSIKEHRTVVSKDTDFYYSYITGKRPYKLILVRLGNFRLRELNQYFESNAEKIIELLKENSFIVLEKGKIKVLD